MAITVKKLIDILKEMPQDAKVTDVKGYVLEDVYTEPKETEPGDWVWFDFSKYEID